jgi:hypothetical protein
MLGVIANETEIFLIVYICISPVSKKCHHVAKIIATGKLT